MSTQLDLYNAALLLCGDRSLASLTEEREPRRLLDQAWADGAVDFCLEEGQWYFAMRGVRIDFEPSIEPDFGYRRVFTKPADWILTAAVCEEEFFRVPLVRYFDEAGFWYSDLDTIYVRYVSNDALFGGDMGSWPRSFYNFVAAHLASKIILKLGNDSVIKGEILKALKEAKKDAKNRNAMAQPTLFPAQGSWTKARNRFLNRRDGGGTGNLIG